MLCFGNHLPQAPEITLGSFRKFAGICKKNNKSVCHGNCFLSYSVESSHHLMAALTPKEAPCQEENITSKT
jgi:hypothetical protein